MNFVRAGKSVYISSIEYVIMKKLISVNSIRKMSTFGPIQLKITECLQTLKPTHLEVCNESFMHNVPKGSESHFKVLVVSSEFKGLQLIKRHRLINNLVKEALQDNFVHALSIEAKSPEEYDGHKIEPSPSCKGGFGK